MKTPTDGSIPALFAPLPKPRMMKLVLVEVCSCDTRSEGTIDARSATSRIDATIALARRIAAEARRALEEAQARREAEAVVARPAEEGGPAGPEPTRFGDWERKGIAVDF